MNPLTKKKKSEKDHAKHVAYDYYVDYYNGKKMQARQQRRYISDQEI